MGKYSNEIKLEIVKCCIIGDWIRKYEEHCIEGLIILFFKMSN